MKTLGKILIGIIATILLICVVLTIGNKITYDSMAEYIDSFGKVEYENQLVPEYDEYGVPYFVTDGDFKVMQLTDVHLCGGLFGIVDDKKAMNAVASMITAEKPDLVVVTGDISFAVPWAGTLDNSRAHSYFKRLMENLGVYWTVAFGNHDSEAYDFYPRDAVADMYEDESLKYCLFDRGPEGLYGMCNHVINVRNTTGLISKSVIVMDTNSYTDEDPLTGTRYGFSARCGGSKLTALVPVDNVCYHTNTEVVGAKEATETEKGYTGDTVCKDCGETLRTGEETPVKTPATPAPTGDAATVAAALAVLAVIGTGIIVTKKREF